MKSTALKIFISAIITVVVTVLLAEVLCRVAGLRPAHEEETKTVLSVKPDFLIRDSVLGWRLGPGIYRHYFNDSMFFYNTSNTLGNRITNTGGLVNDSLSQIHLYGCSFTFGYSSPDTGTYPWYLQQLFIDSGIKWQVQNKGVPGYGLVQMLLTLQREVAAGRKPDIAVVNCIDGHINRTGLCRSWCEGFGYAVKQGLSYGAQDMVYPYAEKNVDSVVITTKKLAELPCDFPLRRFSSLVNLLNSAYTNWVDNNNGQLFNDIHLLNAKAIIEYCRRNNITLIFAALDTNSRQLIDKLNAPAVYTVAFETDMGKPGYSCAPVDPDHPSPLAHKGYAGELLQFLQRNKLVQ